MREVAIRRLGWFRLVGLIALQLGCGSLQNPFQEQAVEMPELRFNQNLREPAEMEAFLCKKFPAWCATPEQSRGAFAIPGSYNVAFYTDGIKGAGMLLAPSTSVSQLPAAHGGLMERLAHSGGGELLSSRYLASLHLPEVTKLHSPSFVERNEGELQRVLERPISILRLDFSDEQAAQRLLDEWHAEGKIAYADPNFLSLPSQAGAGDGVWDEYATFYNSFEGADRKWWASVQLPNAFAHLEEAAVGFTESPIIAVMDSGGDVEHPALKDSIWVNDSPGQAGCANDVNGCNTTVSFKGLLGNGDVFPITTTASGQECAPGDEQGACFHGTHVAGLIAARPSDEVTAYGGACPVCRIMVLKVTGKNKFGRGTLSSIADSSLIAGFNYLSRFVGDRGQGAVRIVNVSLGKFQRSRAVEQLIRLLKNSGLGTLVVAAAGNNAVMQRTYPAAFEDTLAVVNMSVQSIGDDNTNGQYVKASSSNFGVWVDIAAPGQRPLGDCSNGETPCGLLSSVPGGGSFALAGTSMATPVVAGIAGLMLVKEPGLTADEIKQRLMAGADPGFYELQDNGLYLVQVSGEAEPIPLLGRGMVNAFNAVTDQAAGGLQPLPPGNRVAIGCGAIGAGGSAGIWYLLGLVLPLIFVGLSRF